MIPTWDVAFEMQNTPICVKYTDSYKEGFRNGWFDTYLGYESKIALIAKWEYYSMGYKDGRLAFKINNPVIQEGEITCLKNLFQFYD